MSQENVEVVRGVWAEFVRFGFPDDMFTADAKWHVAADEPEGGSSGRPMVGPTEIRRMLASFWETVETPWVQPDEFLDAGDSVIVRWRGGGTGRSSGVAVEWHETHVYVVRDSRVAEVREYREFDDALGAVGLSE